MIVEWLKLYKEPLFEALWSENFETKGGYFSLLVLTKGYL